MDQWILDTLQANLDLPAQGLVVSTWGNVSAIDRERGLVVIKPSGVSYDHMEAGDLVILDLDGQVVSGHRRPSSDTPTHLHLYRSFPGIGSIVHTHSRWATIWAQAGLAIPPYGTTHADYFHGPVPCTRPLTREEIEGQYELNTGHVIVETFRSGQLDPAAVPGILAAGHGPFTWGAHPADAVLHAVALEECAMMAWHTRMLNPEAAAIEQYLLDKHYLRKHGKNAYYGQITSD
ncbi:MAG: L-ribulose-5-phosphate 4-epimerase [Eubacteriales bacterium]|nr:L-ribulose-5-phosphate 4-epimerase [Eubacteriales bacterium]MDD3867295.1 L-ribulose-5-phosphate 4-epimerase [Eubacteriales bacterium]MDD4461768.1 L-ribulose-5-phosphate 4-epimerase [Eubacteriales bacterium]